MAHVWQGISEYVGKHDNYWVFRHINYSPQSVQVSTTAKRTRINYWYLSMEQKVGFVRNMS
jgi:hypothetical protein